MTQTSSRRTAARSGAAPEPAGLNARQLQSQRLETLGMVAAQVAHDFNNVLVSIIGNATIVLDELAPGDPLRERVEAIAAAGDDARALVRQMMSTATTRETLEAIDVTGLVDEVLVFYDAIVEPEPTATFERASWLPMVNGYAVQLRQAILNLLLNAHAALGQGVRDVTVRTGLVSGGRIARETLIGGESPVAGETYVLVSVADSGVGIAPPDLPRVFEPFYTTRPDGTGLGLPAVLTAARNHRGLVAVTSTPGKGSTFTIYLPAGS